MVLAKVTFLGPQQGGRTTRPVSGYHPQIKLSEIHTSCIVRTLDGTIEFEFDKEYLVSLELMFPEEYDIRLARGEVRLYEGAKLIGIGTMTQPGRTE